MDKKYKLGILATHPVQYYVPWYKALAARPEIELKVYYCHRQKPEDHMKVGFGVPFDWDVPLLEGYEYQFLANRSGNPDVDLFFGCDTPEIADIICRNDFDAFVVQGWYVKSFWQAIRACRRKKTPALLHGDPQLAGGRSGIKRFMKDPIYRIFVPSLDGYLVVGKRAREYYLHYGVAEGKMFFVPHAVDNAFFESANFAMRGEKDALRRRWSIPCDAAVFLFAGKLTPKKRPLDFLKALKSALLRGSKAFGLITGDGELRAALESFCGKNGLPVTFTGFLNQIDMPKAYAASDILVLPSDGRETWGLVVNEAMASALPCIVSDRVGCGPDLVHAGLTGEIFPCGDARKLANIMAGMAKNPEAVKRMGEAARRLIGGYSIEKRVEGTLAAVRSLAKTMG